MNGITGNISKRICKFPMMKQAVATATHSSEQIKNIEEISTHFSATILQLLQGYYFLKRGRVHSLVFQEGSLQKSSDTEGSFQVVFKVSYTQGCQDLSFEENDSMQIHYLSDREIIKFSGEETRERDVNEF